jgi:hypothetical protein
VNNLFFLVKRIKIKPATTNMPTAIPAIAPLDNLLRVVGDGKVSVVAGLAEVLILELADCTEDFIDLMGVGLADVELVLPNIALIVVRGR